MLGYDVTIHQLAPATTEAALSSVSTLPYGEGVTFAKTLTDGIVARAAAPVWISGLVATAQAGRADMIHDGGYPYLIRALGADITSVPDLSGMPLARDEWYLVEAWDQS